LSEKCTINVTDTSQHRQYKYVFLAKHADESANDLYYDVLKTAANTSLTSLGGLNRICSSSQSILVSVLILSFSLYSFPLYGYILLLCASHWCSFHILVLLALYTWFVSMQATQPYVYSALALCVATGSLMLFEWSATPPWYNIKHPPVLLEVAWLSSQLESQNVNMCLEGALLFS
jgi:hypothetical protein